MTGKAKDLAEIANLRGQISTCEDVIRKNYIEIGRLYYEKEGLEPGPEYEAMCRAVSMQRQALRIWRRRFGESKGFD